MTSPSAQTTDRLDPELVELAESYGVATDFWDWQGRHTIVPETSVRAVLRALDIDASTPEATRAAAESQRLAPWRRMLPPCVVVRDGTPATVPVHVRDGDPVSVWVAPEDGGADVPATQQHTWVEPRTVDGVLVGEATYMVPSGLPLGWHTLHARSGAVEASAVLVVTPDRLGLPESVRHRRTWGFMTQLYSVRSRQSWGLGDLADLGALATWSGTQLGAGFVLVNPLHSGDPAPPLAPSPYLPSTRRFFSPLYLRVEQVPEYADLPAAARARVDELAAAQQATNTSGELLDRDAVYTAKREALDLVHAVPRSPEREAAFAAFRDREGVGLRDFATWCSLAQEHGLPWQQWPAELQDPQSPAVASARDTLAEAVDQHCWLQWLLDEQLAVAEAAAADAGMPLGVVHDLAVGVHPEGADTWALQRVMARDVGVGAPPDAFNQVGQDWSQPPWRPDMLAETGYAAYRDMLRTILRHAGGIRVDHVPGLFRLWWVPAGASPDAGTYVRYDHEALVGILALEAHRAGAFVVGEDLGTVEPWVRGYLAERGVLGTSILWFEYDGDRPLPPERWRELCLATVTTHDLPPTAGYLGGEHIRIRDSLGLLTRPVEQEREIDAREQAAWLDILRRRGLLSPDANERETVEALHRALLLAPARLVGVALTDAVGDRRAMNQPGTDREYPNWRLPLSDGDGVPVLVEDLVGDGARPELVERARALAASVTGDDRGEPR